MTNAIEVRDPADQRVVVGEVPALSAGDVEAAYARARQALRAWRSAGPLERASVMSRTADLIRERAEDGAVILVKENGKTLAEARVEVGKTADFLDYYASFARQPWGEILSDARPGTQTSVRVEPVGVVLAITPWNDPLITPGRKLGPALIAGNAVLLKAASQTPLIAGWLGSQFADAGLPDDVLQVITGRNGEISDALLGVSAEASATGARPDAVTFTGSNEVGARLRRALADSGTRFQGELGGKNVSVVLADADLDLAAATVVNAAFAQGGQRCTATSRLIIEESIEDAFLGKLKDLTAKITVGPGLDPETTMGPLAYAAHRDGVLRHIERAKNEGATVIAGGGAPADPDRKHGCYVEPTLIKVDPADHALWRDEVFGPVLAITTAKDFDDAVAKANDTTYGLSAAVFTTSLKNANLFLDRSESGQVSVNLPTAGWDVHHPFGGFRDSGSAFKEQGAPGLRFYTRIKTTAVKFS